MKTSIFSYKLDTIIVAKHKIFSGITISGIDKKMSDWIDKEEPTILAITNVGAFKKTRIITYMD